MSWVGVYVKHSRIIHSNLDSVSRSESRAMPHGSANAVDDCGWAKRESNSVDAKGSSSSFRVRSPVDKSHGQEDTSTADCD